MTKTISLDGEWQLRWFDGQRGDSARRMIGGRVDLSRAWPSRVPGSVHETLMDQGVIAEPCLGLNVLSCRWVEEMIWIYRRVFQAQKLRKGERAWLVFERLDLAATIYLNGKQAGQHANAFYPCRVEVTDRLRAGLNTVVVEVESGLYHAMNKSAADLSVGLDHQLTKRPWLRQTQSEHGWDWSPRLLNVGLTGHVRLEIASGARWDNCVVLTEVDDELKSGTVTARVFVEGLARRPRRTELTVRVGGVVETATVTIQPGWNTFTLAVEIPRPKLWWPVGHGAQPRYIARVELKGIGRALKKVGFRRVRINQERHSESGHYFVVEVNGKPVFCKGANLVPSDLILSRIGRSRYVTLVDRALEQHFNMLRVWGGGVYEADDFYDLCDERGMLVWQEFVFACAKYPTTDGEFMADVKREAMHQIRRLAHHPSLVIWCGNNEMEWFNWMPHYTKGAQMPDHGLFHLALPRLLQEEDPTRYYQPSSPYSPGVVNPNADDRGDQHPWGVGFGETDFRKYRQMTCRFPNEGGILGPTSLPTVRACAERIGSFAWELHDNGVSYWDLGPLYAPDQMITQWTGRTIREMGLDDYVYWGGLVQGAGLSEYVKNFRRRMFDSASAIFWMYNDVWPATRSWTTVDHQLRRTPAFWPVKRAMAPVIVVVTRQHNRVKIYGVNDGAELKATLRYGLLKLVGEYPVDETRSVTLAGNASTVLAEFDAREWDRLGVTTHVAFALLSVGGTDVARDTLILPLYREMKWPPARITVRHKDGKAVIASRTFAFRVCLDLDGDRSLPDNFFDVYPGIPTVLDWPSELGEVRVLRVGNGM